MAGLPVVSGSEAAKAFRKLGFSIHHQTGSHIVLYREHPERRHLSVPNHRELAPGTLRALIKAAGITVEDFVNLL
jgi:predicted RNA binding protein YcfA (HicA-like mRNA interferase family)